jgi:hypothetical protein
MLLKMLTDNGSKTSLDQLIKDRWFLEKFDNILPNQRLTTIKSLTYHDTESLFFEDD